LQSVALTQPMRHMEADHAAEHFDSGLEQHHGGGAVDVVVAVKQDWLARGDGAFQALHRSSHAVHGERVMQMRDFRIEKLERSVCAEYASSNEQLRQHLRQMGCFGQLGRCFGVNLFHDPALIWTPAGFSARCGRRGCTR
jgi:hypothetical protein